MKRSPTPPQLLTTATIELWRGTFKERYANQAIPEFRMALADLNKLCDMARGYLEHKKAVNRARKDKE